jgi:hypothetical protein
MLDRRSVGAYIIRIGAGVVRWKSKKQSCVALSSTDAEYMALCQASKEAVWMTDFLQNLGVSPRMPMAINADNQGSITLVNNRVFHDRSKYLFTYSAITRANSSSRKGSSITTSRPTTCQRMFSRSPCPRTQHCLQCFTTGFVLVLATLDLLSTRLAYISYVLRHFGVFGEVIWMRDAHAACWQLQYT